MACRLQTDGAVFAISIAFSTKETSTSCPLKLRTLCLDLEKSKKLACELLKYDVAFS